MSRIRIALLTAVALAATVPSLAAAQEWRGRGGGGEQGGRGPRPEGGAPAGQPGQAMQAPGGGERGFTRNDGGDRGGRDWNGGQRQAQMQPAPAPQAQPQPQPQPSFQGQPRFPGQPRGEDRSRFAGGPPPARGDDARRDPGARYAPDGGSRPGFAAGGRPDPRGYDARGNDQRGYASRGYDARFAGQARVGADWRADRRYDWRGYRDTHRQQFRVGRYVAPRGWGYGYQRLSIGYRIDPYFYAANYWIDDPYAYRLPPVWGTYRWVRYYDDALLIDTANGVVIDAIPDFFW